MGLELFFFFLGVNFGFYLYKLQRLLFSLWRFATCEIRLLSPVLVSDRSLRVVIFSHVFLIFILVQQAIKHEV